MRKLSILLLFVMVASTALAQSQQELIQAYRNGTLSQEQINVYHLHGYTAALILPDGVTPEGEACSQGRQKYIAITITGAHEDPFRVIPGGYRMLMTYMKTNGIRHLQDPSVIACFEREYMKDGVPCMDVFIAAE